MQLGIHKQRASPNTDNKINKLVTVFALILCTLENNKSGDKTGFPPLPVETPVTMDNNRRRFALYRDTAPVHLDHSVTGDNIWRASHLYRNTRNTQ